MPKKILVIDDEELITRSLLRLLDKEGYNTTVVRSGKEALEKIKDIDFDLIVCDVRMPEMDGVETIKEIRSYLKSSHKELIPEILITGYADKEKYEAAMGLKVADYLYKPFDMSDFLQAIKKTIG